MSTSVYDINGTLREEWDDDARTYTEYDEQGAEVSSRPYTAEENARADAEAAQALVESNRRTIEEALGAALATLQTTIDTANATINAGPAVYVKDIARIQRRIIRLLTRRFDGTT